MPSEADIAREIGRDVDPDAIFARAQQLRAAIGARLGPHLRETYRRMQDDGPFSPDAASAGRRALKNVVPRPARRDAGASAIALAARQYHQRRQHDRPHGGARDAVAARGAGTPGRARRFLPALFAAIRSSSTNGSRCRLRSRRPQRSIACSALTRHPAFSLTNPNRVRSLIGAFAQLNQTQFNRADGAGYEFLADTVLQLDPKNPQVAARITTAFRSWRALEPVRRARAEAALRRIAAASTPVARPARHRRSLARCALDPRRLRVQKVPMELAFVECRLKSAPAA